MNNSSILTIVKKSLRENPNVIITDLQKDIRDSSGSLGCRYRGSNFHVAPIEGLYTAKELQEFMLSLIPVGLEAANIHDFKQKYNGLKLGYLHFDQIIGTVKTEAQVIIESTDDEFIHRYHLDKGKRVITKSNEENYHRRVWISPYPNKFFAQDIDSGELKYRSIFNSELLQKYAEKEKSCVESVPFIFKLQ